MRGLRGLWVAVTVGVVASALILVSRWGIESRSRTVEIILDGPDWEGLALREGQDPDEILAAAAQRGATSVALYERTLRRLADNGQVAYISGEELQAPAFLAPPPSRGAPLDVGGEPQRGTIYITAAPARLDELTSVFAGLLGEGRVRRLPQAVAVRGLQRDLEETGLGFAPEDVGAYRRLGLLPVLRLRNLAGLSEQGLDSIGARLASVGPGAPVVFESVEVLGFERLLPETAAVLRKAGLRYGRIEVFSARRKQRGEDRLAQEMGRDVIRLFSLTPEELLVLPQQEARDKFVRAARERNIRLLYVRPFVPTAGVVGTEINLRFVGDLAADLRRSGFALGRAAPLEEVRVHPVLRAGAALGALAAIGLGLILAGGALGLLVPVRVAWLLVGAGLIATAGLMVRGPLTLWLKVLALAAASILPGVAIMRAIPGRPGPAPVWSGVRGLLVASVVSTAGGVIVSALLTAWTFMMAADLFTGVKLAQLLPVLLVALLAWRHDRPARSWRMTVRELWAWSAHPLLLRYAVAALLVAVAAVMLLVRSGNFGLPLLGFEERLRTVLEDLLVARPRTKEYLIGHPAVVLAGVAATLGWRAWVLPLAAIGAVGQAGIVNSFSHIHTPLVITVWRTVHALWLGTVIGAAAAAVLLAAVRRLAPRQRAPGRAGTRAT